MRPVRIAALALLALGVGLTVPATASAPFKGSYLMGAAAEEINPTAAEIKAGDFYLGGYGLGSGKALNKIKVIDGRAATGIMRNPQFHNGLADGSHVRAVAFGAGANALVLAQIETQGMFEAYKQGPYGLIDIRKDAAVAIAKLHKGPAVTAGSIVVDSNHTHGGPDTAGVWGGVPTTYLKHVHDQSVKAIVEAYQRMQKVDLYFGTAHAGVVGEASRYPSSDPLMTNQFSRDPANQEMDDELRVLQGRGPKGQVVATYLNYSAHPTVLDSDNLQVSADYTGPLAAMLSSLGGVGMEQVGTLGRSQPARDDCPNKKLTGPAANVCKVNTYASRVFKRTQQAIKSAKLVTGNPVVAMHSYFIQDLATNAPIVALTYGGLAAGAPIYRASNPPWIAGSILGTSSFSGRIGDILLSGGPGEFYPQIVGQVKAAVPARGHINIGTAGDFLGYIIAPFEAYPEPLRRGFFDGQAPPAGSLDCTGGVSPVAIPSPIGCPSPIDNDNYFFNASHTMGERLTCSMLRGAGEVMKGDKMAYWSGDARCPLFANDFAVPTDFDTTFPAQPDLAGVPGFDH